MSTATATLVFADLNKAVSKQLKALTKNNSALHVIDPEVDLWPTYLENFPESERQEHNCNACKRFIRDVGGVVRIKADGTVETIWDAAAKLDGYYGQIASALRRRVLASPIYSRFYLTQKQQDALIESNFSDKTGTVIKWEHLYFKFPAAYIAYDKPRSVGRSRDMFGSLQRAVKEFTPAAVEAVLKLLREGNLYRGATYKTQVEELQKLQQNYLNTLNDNLIWLVPDNSATAGIRGSSIGTLLKDVSEGLTVEAAVRRYNGIVDPRNYRRSVAPASVNQIELAQRKIEELGYTRSLGRRYAVKDDLLVSNCQWVDRGIRPNSVFEQLKAEVSLNPEQIAKKAQDVSIQDFLETVLPTAHQVKLLYTPQLQNNLMTLVAPENPDAPSLLAWDNGLSWYYNGAVADSIRQRVKAAGGKVNGVLRCSLAWSNYDDLDLHLNFRGPYGDAHVYYGSPRYADDKTQTSLDVDMNAGYGQSRTPVENIIFSRIADGVYKFSVNQFCPREKDNQGFSLELEVAGKIYTVRYPYNKSVRDIVVVTVKDGQISFKANGSQVTVTEGAEEGGEVWGLKPNQLQTVSAVALSPNHWGDSAIGLKHYFFLLDGLKPSGPSRAFMNEFLKRELNDHRKVFELLGEKVTISGTPELSGLGFSHDQSFYCQVTGENGKRYYKVTV